MTSSLKKSIKVEAPKKKELPGLNLDIPKQSPIYNSNKVKLAKYYISPRFPKKKTEVANNAAGFELNNNINTE